MTKQPTKLSDTALVILSTACARDDRSVLPLTKTLNGEAKKKVFRSLLTKGLIAARPAKFGDRDAFCSMDGADLVLTATDAAFEALGMDAPAKPAKAADAAPQPQEKPKGKPRGRNAVDEHGNRLDGKPHKAAKPKAKKATKSAVKTAKASGKDATKADLVADMLRRPNGATITEIMAETGWLPHTTRARISNFRKAGATITTEKEPGGERVYRLA